MGLRDPRHSRRRHALNEIHVDLAGRIPHHWLATATGSVSTRDLVGDGLTLFTGPEGEPWSRAAESVLAAARVAITAHQLDQVSARALGILGDGALLVRPDSLPVAVYSDSAGATARLQDVTAAATGRVPERTAA